MSHEIYTFGTISVWSQGFRIQNGFTKRKLFSLVASLRRTLTKCKVLGWMEQITGHGFTGTYRLSFPFYPRYVNDSRKKGAVRLCNRFVS